MLLHFLYRKYAGGRYKHFASALHNRYTKPKCLKIVANINTTMNQEQISKITKVLRDNSRGMTVTEISKEIGLNRNSVAKYLEVLLISGHVEMRSYGPAKVFFLSQRVPMSALIDFSSDYIIILDRDLKTIQVNDNFLKLVNIERETMLGQKLEDFAPNAFNTPEMTANLKATLNGKKITQEMECSIGEVQYYFNLKSIPITFEDGLPGVTMILEDITERKKMEEKLRKSEQYYRLVCGSISDGVYVLDREWRYVLANDAGLRLVRMSKEKLLGNKLTDLFPGVEKTGFFKTYKRVMETRKPGTVINEYVFENGKRGWFEARVYPVPEGILCIVMDVTERKSAEDERVRLSNAVKMPIDSIVITDVDARIIDVNEATLKLYGADDKRDLVGKCFFDLVAPEDREKVSAVVKEALEKEYRKILHFEIVTKDGTRKTIEMSLAVMKDADGGSMGLVGVSRDIPEPKKTK